MEHRIEEGAGTQFDAKLANHMRELGLAGDLAHIVGHTADGIPAVTCPHCGSVIAIPRNTEDRNIIYCRACHGQLELHRAADTFEAEKTGRTDDPQKLEPHANEAAVDDILAQIS